MNYPHLAARFFNTPLLLTSDAADIVSAYLLSRIDGSADIAALARPAPAGILQRDAVKAPYYVDQGIAMIPVNGKLMNRGGVMDAMSGVSSYESIIAAIQQADADPTVNGLLLEMDTPGGEVAGLAAMTQTMNGIKKPLWSIANSMSASAGYHIAASTQRTAVVPSGTSGSVGTVIVMRDIAGALDRQGIKHAVIRSGSKKMQASGIEGISAEAITRAQELVDAESKKFFQHVSNKRGIDMQAIIDLQGAALTADEALAAGLIDQVATVHDFHQSMVAAMRKGSARAASSSAASATATHSKALLLSRKGPHAMNEDFCHTAADLSAAVTAAASTSRNEGTLIGATQERARIKAIMHADTASKRPTLAAKLAFDTDMSPAVAADILGASAEEAAATVAASTTVAAPQTLLAAAMAQVKNPAVGGSIDNPVNNLPDDGTLDPKAAEAAAMAQVHAQFGKPRAAA